MKTPDDRQISIAKRIVDGSIRINSIKEFRRLLKIFPDDPGLHKVFSDLLVRKDSLDAAADFYGKAADLYIEKGEMLAAILCKSLEWKISRPSPWKIKKFYEILRIGSYPESAVTMFFKRLAVQEFSALVDTMERVQLPAGKTIRKLGGKEKDVNFIVNGSVKVTTFAESEHEEAESERMTSYLSANGVMGDVYPFKDEKISFYYAETVEPVEMIRITKSMLMRVCTNQPRIELNLIDLFKTRAATDEDEFLRMVRRTQRREMPIKMKLKIWMGSSDKPPLALNGYSKDLSVGGMCIILDKKYAKLQKMLKKVDNAKIQMSLPGEAMTMNVMGDIVWSKQLVLKGDKTLAIGIQFNEMSPKMSGMLLTFVDTLFNLED